MLWEKYPEELDDCTLAAAYKTLEGDPSTAIPWIVWLLENPASRLAMPGSIDLFGHDCLHLLLKQEFRSENEAFVVGFTMGNNIQTNWIHFLIFKIASLFFYPQTFRLSYSELEVFDRGVELGRSIKHKNLNQTNFTNWNHKVLQEIRSEIGLVV